MGNTLLIIVGIFMVAMTAIGLKRGMLKMAFSLISVVVVLLLVNILTPPTKQLLKATPIYTGIQNTIEEYVSNNIESSAQSVTQTGVGAQKKIIEKLPLPKEIKATLNENNTEESYASLKVTTFSEYIAESLTDMVMNAVTFIILFFPCLFKDGLYYRRADKRQENQHQHACNGSCEENAQASPRYDKCLSHIGLQQLCKHKG